jgi:hypothetical protein
MNGIEGWPDGDTTEKRELSPAAIMLRDIFYDRSRHIDEKIQMPETIEVEDEPAVANIELLSNLNGHRGADLRSIAQSGASPVALHLQKLYQWSIASLKSSPTLPEEEIPALLTEVKNDPELLYERLLIAQQHPNADADNYQAILFTRSAEALDHETDGDKWTDLIEQIATENDPKKTVEKLLTTIGFIPSELLNKKKFKNLGAEYIIGMLDALRELENSELRKQAAHERAGLLNYLITSKSANQLRRKNAPNITLDTNGIFINLRGFHSHLPYGLINERCLTELAADYWLDDDDAYEVQIRAAEENSDSQQLEQASQKQLEDFVRRWGFEQIGIGEALDRLFVELSNNPEKFAQELSQKKLTIPDILINRVLASGAKENIFALLRTAEAIGANISQESLRQETDLLSSHAVTNTTQATYETRAQVINDPNYYNSLKITKAFLSSGVESDPDNQFLMFRGQYKKSSQGHQHSFIEILHQGRLARVLIDEEKHLGTSRQQSLKHIELFEREQYENLENALQTFNYFVANTERMAKIATRRTGKWQVNFSRLAETGLHFLLTNVTKHYQAASALYEKIKYTSDSPESAYAQLLEIFQQAQVEYEQFFYHNIATASNFSEKFSPEVKKFDISFGQSFVDECEQNTADDGHNAELCLAAPDIRICEVAYKTGDPTETIPYHIEESCVDALRLQRNRPLINVIGGCREAKGAANPLDTLSRAVISVAHEHKANVGVPGTQSGIGNTFGWANVNYRNQFGHLPHSEQAHLFAVNPGGNTFFPGNKRTSASERDQVFANTPVDSIITPFEAGWGMQGNAKYKSPYLNHVAYMEAIYQRLAHDQPKVMVVGNGGLYSIAEINESLKRDFDLILVEGTGRFADAAAVIIKHIDKIEIPNDPQKISEQVIALLRKILPADIAKEFFKKDFGSEHQTDNEDYQVFRTFFWNFLKLAKAKQRNIQTTSLEQLEQTLDKYLSK